MHPIADYIVRTFTWDKWYCDLLHYVLCLNPLHFLVDITIGKFHSRYYTVFDGIMSYQMQHYASENIWDTSFQNFDRPQRIELIEKQFWMLLGIDQLAHVWVNVVFAAIMEMII